MSWIPDWLRAPFAWELAAYRGAYCYEQNAVTGARRAIRFTQGHSPIDQGWLAGGSWTNFEPVVPGRPPPPLGLNVLMHGRE